MMCIGGSSYKALACDSVTCEEYPDFCPRLTRHRDRIIYYMSDNPDANLPPADSIWIEGFGGPYGSGTFIRVVHALEGEDIDISDLEVGYYILNIQLGECIAGKLFFGHRRPEEAIEDPAVMPSATKILRDGQLFIRRGEKEWTITGQEVRLR